MRAKFTRGDGGRLGIRFEPETFEEQLLLEFFIRDAAGRPFELSSYEYDHGGRPMREGLTSCWGQVSQPPVVSGDTPIASGDTPIASGNTPIASGNTPT